MVSAGLATGFPGGLAAGLWLAVVAGAAFIQGFNINRTVEITGHRGSKVRAPENTLSALRQAIAEGADYAEIDVQTTADGVVVLLHDADLMRVASVERRLRDIKFDELSDIDVGSWFMPEFSNERIPTLQEAIDLARGRIKLNIELKFTWPDPALAETGPPTNDRVSPSLTIRSSIPSARAPSRVASFTNCRAT